MSTIKYINEIEDNIKENQLQKEAVKKSIEKLRFNLGV